MFSLWKILVKASCSPDFPPIFWFPKVCLEREIHCNQDAMSSSQAGAMQNRLAQQRQISRSCSFRCNLSQNRRPLAKTQGMSLQTHMADPLLGVPILIFSVVFLQQKKIRNKNQNKNQGGTLPQQMWTPIDRVACTWMQVLVWVRYSHQWLSTLVTVSKLTLSLRLLLNVSLTKSAQQYFMHSIFMESIQNVWSQKNQKETSAETQQQKIWTCVWSEVFLVRNVPS